MNSQGRRGSVPPPSPLQQPQMHFPLPPSHCPPPDPHNTWSSNANVPGSSLHRQSSVRTAHETSHPQQHRNSLPFGVPQGLPHPVPVKRQSLKGKRTKPSEPPSSEVAGGGVQLDAWTQTTPLSLSPSSSFCWMSEEELQGYQDVEEPQETTRELSPTTRFLQSLPLGVRPPTDSDSSEEGDFGTLGKPQSTKTKSSLMKNDGHQQPSSSSAYSVSQTWPAQTINQFHHQHEDDSLMLSEGSGTCSSDDSVGMAQHHPHHHHQRDAGNSAAQRLAAPQPPPRRINLVAKDDAQQRSMIPGCVDSSPASVPSPVQLDEAFDESLKLLLQYTYQEGSNAGKKENGRMPLDLSEGPSRMGIPRSSPKNFSQIAAETGLASSKSEPARATSPPMGESIYDNVPNLTRKKISYRNGPTVDCWVSGGESPGRSPGDGVRQGIPRDISIQSGILADSESSPMSPHAEVIGAAITPESTKSLTSSEGSFSLILQPMPEINTTSITNNSDRKGMNSGDSEVVPDGPKDQGPPATNGRPPPPPPSPGHGAFRRPFLMAGNSLPVLDRAGSYDELALSRHSPFGETLRSQGSDSGFSSSKERAEAEASECCKWLRAAGFPQYAQMYEEQQFPLELNGVHEDHEFLDADSIRALFRRLETLNRCALRKSGNIILRRPPAEDESDEDEVNVALSNKWRYQRKSKTWSRIGAEFGDLRGTDSSTSPYLKSTGPRSHSNGGQVTGDSLDSLNTLDTFENPADSVHVMVAESVERQHMSPRFPTPEHQFEASDTIPPSRLQRSQSERIKDQTKAFMRRMGLVKGRNTRRPGRSSLKDPPGQPQRELVIGQPVLVGSHSASPPHMRMLKPLSVPEDSATTDTVFDRIGSIKSDRVGTTQFDRSERDQDLVNVREEHLQHRTHSQDPRRRGLLMAGSQRPISPQFEEREEFVDSNSNIQKKTFPRTPGPKPQENNFSPNPEIHPPSSAALARSWVRNYEESPKSRTREDHLSGASSESVGMGQERYAGGNGGGLVLYNPSFGQRGPAPGAESPSYFHDPVRINRQESSPEWESRRAGSGRAGPGRLGFQQSHSSMESSDTENSRQWDQPERRDSGVGSSLSRSPSGPMRGKGNDAERAGYVEQQMDGLSLPHLTTLRKLAVLSLTGLMEKHAPHKTGGGGWSWGVTRLFKRIKNPETKNSKERSVFGVPLSAIAQQNTLPLPQCILHVMRFLRQQGPESVGIFRKSGVRSRINKLKELCESSTEMPVLDPQQTYDLADMLKQYFRELPDPLITAKLSDTFIATHLYLPPALRLEAMQKAVILLPDENREVLHSLLAFLNDIAAFADTNQMTAQNLAVCLAPSLFQLSPRLAALSPTRRHKTITAGLPNERELRENMAAQACLTQMIVHYKRLFVVPPTMRGGLFSPLPDHSPATLQQLGQPRGNYITYLDACVSALIKEQKERWKGWMTEGSSEGVEISCKKLLDGNPLKLWRVWTEVEAPPKEVLERVVRERDVWDEDVLKWKVVKRLADNTDIFQFVQNDMPPHPTRDYCLLRQWRQGLPELRGGCVLVETSVSAREAPLLGGVRAFALASRFLIEPSGAGRSRITYVSRIDTKGRGKSWYNKIFGYICARQIAHLRDSFRQVDSIGPETKV